MNRIPLIYALHSGNLYGTERMALATAAGLSDEFDPVMLAPPGPVFAEATRMGLQCASFRNANDFVRRIRPIFASSKRVALIATGIAHSFGAMALNSYYRRFLSHLHVVHGGTDERLSYGRKKLLNGSSALLVAVSEFVKDRLIANGARARKVRVIENFLTESRVRDARRRPLFSGVGVKKVTIISRLDPIKRVDLLLDALDRSPALAQLQVRVLGTGWELESLRERAARTYSNVKFAGFVADVESELAASDLLVHTCPAEPFGLAIIEAMAAGVPVLVPDRGGAGSLVQDGISGFHFTANNPDSLASSITRIVNAPASDLNQIVSTASQVLNSRFSCQARIRDYRNLLQEGFA